MILNLDSQVDVITNSSSTIFSFVQEDGIEKAKEFLQDIMEGLGVKGNIDDYVKIYEYIPSEMFKDTIEDILENGDEDDILKYKGYPKEKKREKLPSYIKRQKAFMEERGIEIKELLDWNDFGESSIYIDFITNDKIGFDLLAMLQSIFGQYATCG